MAQHRPKWNPLFARRPCRPRRLHLNLERLEDRVCLDVAVTGLTSLHAGDRVLITGYLSTTDPNEGGEGEPLLITINGTTVATVSAYFVPSTFRHLALGDEIVSASIQGEDGDEDGTVTVSLDYSAGGPQTQRFSPEEKNKFNRLSAEENLEAARDAKAAGLATIVSGGLLFAAILSSPTGGGPLVFGGGSASFASLAGFYAYLSAQRWRAAAEYQLLALDPPDPNFTTVAEPVVHPLTLSLRPNDASLAPQLAAFNALFVNGETETAVAGALNTAVNRASGAEQAGDQASLDLQEQAVRRFSNQLADTLAARPALLTAAQNAARSLGVPLTSTPSDVLAFEKDVQRNGLPAPIRQTLQLTGATSPPSPTWRSSRTSTRWPATPWRA
jgi:hypothetical protein